MATAEDFQELGRRITSRRAAKGLSSYSAAEAGGPAAKTWDRIAKGDRIAPATLYQVCQTLFMTEDEARPWFALVGFDFDDAAYRRPPALERLVSSLKDARRATDEALAAALQLEVESRGEQ